jgi:hypothetical protein
VLQVFAAEVDATVDGVCHRKGIASLLLNWLWLQKVTIGGVGL